MIDTTTQRYALFALLAAALFGISAPLAKSLGAGMSSVMLAGLLYLGSGLALATLRLVRRGGVQGAESPMRRQALPWLLGAVVFGGALGPVLLIWGLHYTTGAFASLLLGLEGILTAVVAALAFRESVDRRVWVAGTLILAASAALALPGGGTTSWIGVLAIAGACLCWALDNNLTRPISSADPLQIAATKGLLAGGFNLALALFLGQSLPAWPQLAAALCLGALSYGVSLVLFILALRHLGSARAGAHFGTAPFFGAGFAVLLGEPVTAWLILAVALTALATWLVLTERHQHAHTHEPMAHEHFHQHDDHHRHDHDFPWDPAKGHAHPHRHTPLTHSHAHLPDLHHRHGHESPIRRQDGEM